MTRDPRKSDVTKGPNHHQGITGSYHDERRGHGRRRGKRGAGKHGRNGRPETATHAQSNDSDEVTKNPNELVTESKRGKNRGKHGHH